MTFLQEVQLAIAVTNAAVNAKFGKGADMLYDVVSIDDDTVFYNCDVLGCAVRRTAEGIQDFGDTSKEVMAVGPAHRHWHLPRVFPTVADWAAQLNKELLS